VTAIRRSRLARADVRHGVQAATRALEDGGERRRQRIRALQRQAAATSSCGVALSTSGDEGRYVVDGVACASATVFT
jgi:hypothetical protein